MNGTYKVTSKGDTVTFNFMIPVGQGAYVNTSPELMNPADLSISPYRSIQNGKLVDVV